jgi:hypothetical protein
MPISQPRLGYKEKTHIDSHRNKMASAAMVYFGLDPGKFVGFLVGKYTRASIGMFDVLLMQYKVI